MWAGLPNKLFLLSPRNQRQLWSAPRQAAVDTVDMGKWWLCWPKWHRDWLAKYLEQAAPQFCLRSLAFPTSFKEHLVWNPSRKKKGRKDHKDTLSNQTNRTLWNMPGHRGEKHGNFSLCTLCFQHNTQNLLRLLQQDWNYGQAHTCLTSCVRTNFFWQRELWSILPRHASFPLHLDKARWPIPDLFLKFSPWEKTRCCRTLPTVP